MPRVEILVHYAISKNNYSMQQKTSYSTIWKKKKVEVFSEIKICVFCTNFFCYY